VADVTAYLVVAALASAGAADAGRPDFSGKWVLEAPAAVAGAAQGSGPPTLSAHGTMGSGWGPELTVTQDASALTVEYTYFHPRDAQPPFRLKYLLDGTPAGNTLNMGRGPQEQVSQAYWEGDGLVITTTHVFVDPRDGRRMATQTRQRLTLESPALLVVETTRSGVTGQPSTTRSVYKRQ
jgi:hypothetical protein